MTNQKFYSVYLVIDQKAKVILNSRRELIDKRKKCVTTKGDITLTGKYFPTCSLGLNRKEHIILYRE